MFEELYLETDEEVTSAVEKIKKSKKRNLALCLPRNSVLGQSIVNLKLIYKEAKSEGKEIALVTPDASVRNLAQRVGFSVFPSVKEIDFHSVPEVDDVKPKKNSKKEEKKQESKKEEDSDEKEPTEESNDPSLKSAGFTSQSLTPEESEKEPKTEEADSAHADETPTPREDKPVAEKVHTTPERDNMIPTRGNLRLFRHKKRRMFLIPLFIILGILLVAGVATALFVPNATVKITVAAQPFNETVKSAVDTAVPSIDPDKGVIPGKALTLEQITKSSTKATGKKDLGQKATGTVTLVNEWDSLAHSFPAGTKIRAANGNEFVLANDVTVPGASSSVIAGKPVIVAGKKDASVEAVLPGESYNNAPTTFTIPSLPKAQQEKIYATSSVAFTGGTSKIVTVVTQSDIDKLLENVKTQNKDEAIKKLKEQAGDAILLDKAIQVVSQDASASVAAEAEAESVEGTVKGNFRVIVFSKTDQQQLLEKLLANKIPQGQKIVSQGEGVAIDLNQYDLNLVTDSRLELTNNLKAFTVTQFDENAVRRSLIGVVPSEVNSTIIKRVPLENVEYKVTPSWWPRMPLNGSKIKVEYAYKAKEPTPEEQKEE